MIANANTIFMVRLETRSGRIGSLFLFIEAGQIISIIRLQDPKRVVFCTSFWSTIIVFGTLLSFDSADTLYSFLSGNTNDNTSSQLHSHA